MVTACGAVSGSHPSGCLNSVFKLFFIGYLQLKMSHLLFLNYIYFAILIFRIFFTCTSVAE